jgi:hypothetical protein
MEQRRIEKEYRRIAKKEKVPEQMGPPKCIKEACTPPE